MKYKNWKLGNGPLGLHRHFLKTQFLWPLCLCPPVRELETPCMGGPGLRTYCDWTHTSLLSASATGLCSQGISRSSLYQEGHSWRASHPAWVPPASFRSVLTRENTTAGPCSSLSAQTTVPRLARSLFSLYINMVCVNKQEYIQTINLVRIS